MNELTYKQILSGYQVTEEGDFFQLYRLPVGIFVVYSPKLGKIGCIELCTFIEVSPTELALLLNQNTHHIIEDKEFIFDVCVDKSTVLQYLFDITSIDDKTKYFKHSVQPGSGYILEAISVGSKKPKAINLFSFYEDEIALAFDNQLTYLDNGNVDANNLYITFDPKKYHSVVDDATINREFFIMLLASGSHLLLSKIYEYEKNTSLLIGQENPLEILKLYVFYLNKSDADSVFVDSDNVQVIVGFKKEIYPITDIMNLMNLSIKDVREELGNEINTFFEIKSTKDFTYISFRNARLLISSFNKKLRDTFKDKIKIVTVV